MNIKSEKGFTGADISVALVIIVLFAGLISSLLYSFGVKSKEIDRKSDATYLAVSIIEGIKQMDYDSVKEDTNGGLTVADIETVTGSTIDVADGYSVTINVQNYKDKVGDETLKDVMKIVTVTVSYTVGQEQKQITLDTVITKDSTSVSKINNYIIQGGMA